VSIYYVSERELLLEAAVDELKVFLHQEVDFPNLYPNFRNVNVGVTHPFAIIQAAMEANQRVEAAGLFPSVTLGLPNEGTETAFLNGGFATEQVTSTTVQTWLALAESGRLISSKKLQTLLTEVQTTPAWASVAVEEYSQQLAFALWAENEQVARVLYQLCKAFMKQKRVFFENLGFENYTYTGSPTGLYSVDLGRVLYGGELAYAGTNQSIDRYIDTTWTTINHVNHSVAHGDLGSNPTA